MKLNTQVHWNQYGVHGKFCDVMLLLVTFADINPGPTHICNSNVAEHGQGNIMTSP